MDAYNFYHCALATPAFITDEMGIRRQMQVIKLAVQDYACELLYSVKACNSASVMRLLADGVDGFSVTSDFEARLVHEVSRKEPSIHLVAVDSATHLRTPAIRFESVVCNSLHELDRSRSLIHKDTRLGVRLNPNVSIVEDERYNPCRISSKLGVKIDDFAVAWSNGDLLDVSGIHVHNASGMTSWAPLRETVRTMADRFGSLLQELDWINLGGGYVWNKTTDFGPLRETIEMLNSKYGLKVLLEPGAGFVQAAGLLVASVVDIFESDGCKIAILDACVNHLPEVFEYQFEPDIRGHVDEGRYTYQLAGCSCLAGDIFGTYSFNEPLEIGSRVVFENVGAYSIVKAHMFNGINLPTIYTLTESGELLLTKQFTYEDFASRCGVDTRATI